MIRKKRSQILQFLEAGCCVIILRNGEMSFMQKNSAHLCWYTMSCVCMCYSGENCCGKFACICNVPQQDFLQWFSPLYLSCLSSPQVIVCIQPVVHNVIGCCQLSAAFSCFQLACAITHLRSPRVTLFINGYMCINLKVKG